MGGGDSSPCLTASNIPLAVKNRVGDMAGRGKGWKKPLIKILEDKLASYRTTVEQDDAALAPSGLRPDTGEPMSDNARSALSFTRLEKLMIKAIIDKLQSGSKKKPKEPNREL